jgi:hypothetical protein
MGPIIIFDKSSLQSLSVDESVWLENFFLINITPLFYIETLGDIEKEVKGNKTSQQIVSNIALKTPQNSYPNMHHSRLLVHNLLGGKVDMANRPNLGGGIFKESPDGKIGVHYEKFVEAEAMQRWQEEKFLEIEKNFAKKWRKSLSNIDFDYMIGLAKNIIPKGKKFKNLVEIKDFVDNFVQGGYKELYELTFEVLKIPDALHSNIMVRWEKEQYPNLEIFAPYAAYVLKINLFFFLSMNSSLISKDRPSNMIDIAYLYYLPFCMVFTSNDKLHMKTAPLFMEQGQIFIKGQDLKSSLKELDEYYSKLSNEIKNQGVMKFAVYPPEEMNTLVVNLWDKFLPIWRKHCKEKKRKPIASKESEKNTVDNINKLVKEAKTLKNTSLISDDEVEHFIFKRMVSVKKGKWRLLPPEVEKANRKDES